MKQTMLILLSLVNIYNCATVECNSGGAVFKLICQSVSLIQVDLRKLDNSDVKFLCHQYVLALVDVLKNRFCGHFLDVSVPCAVLSGLDL